MHPDKAQHTIHRLEGFSDIVIGFCLAQLGLNLVLPRSGADMFSVWASTTFFISAFVFIAVLWWLHHRTFSTFFALTMPMVVLNFAMLCGLILTLYFLESTFRIAELGENPGRFLGLCVFSLVVVYSLVGTMLLVGLIARRAELPPDDIRWGVEQLTRLAFAILFGLGAGTYLVLSKHSITIASAAIVSVIAIIVARLLPRWLTAKTRRA